MRLDGRRMDVALPCGLRGVEEGPHRRATLVPLDGGAELLVADEPNPFLAAHLMLARCLRRLGARVDVSVDDVRSLLVADRDFLVIQLDRLTFGDVRYQTMRCPLPECASRMDVEIDLSSVVAPEPPRARELTFALVDGRHVRFRMMAAGDQEALADVPSQARAAALFDRCLLGAPEELCRTRERLEPREQTALALAIGEATPLLDLALGLMCPKCNGPFVHVYDPLRGLFGRIRRSRNELLTEVHHLAIHYHWSHREILELPRTLRREYLEILERELSPRKGVG